MSFVTRSTPTEKECHDLLVASHNGDLPRIQELLHLGVSVNYTNAGGKFPLFYATIARRIDAIQYLIRSGASLDITARPEQHTPLYIAVNTCYLDGVRILLAAGASPDIPDSLGRTPFVIAISRSYLEIARCLINHGGKFLDQPDHTGKTPLIYAMLEGYSEIVQNLIKAKVNVNHIGQDGKTPLHIAVIRGDGKMVESLLREGASVNCFDKFMTTPLYHAFRTDRECIAHILLKEGAWVYARAEHDEKTLWEFFTSISRIRPFLINSCSTQIWSPQVHSLAKKSTQKMIETIMKIWSLGENAFLVSLAPELLFHIFNFLL